MAHALAKDNIASSTPKGMESYNDLITTVFRGEKPKDGQKVASERVQKEFNNGEILHTEELAVM